MEPRKANVVVTKAFLDFDLEDNEVPCEFPVFEDYIDVLNSASLDKKVEKKMRIATVHAYNDKRRHDNKDLSLSIEAKENIIKLLPMCENPLFIAELYRELGEFEKANSAIKAITEKDLPIYKLIAKLIAEKVT